ncbi:MAG: tRNA uridine-5-carboxymethylaminomethyl(34) synthesis enzyme MnmG [Bacteriovoracaceae bacterium]|nr:tRNA uridine-5-carboxymethylaminomethyl(34) synthesis enzyme MnmG [Bacteriovoracaceae bacterium]
MGFTDFDIVVIGGGHAGIEACFMAQQFGLKVGLFSMKGIKLGSAPCNPAIGGVGKAQVVREIDALGGLMGMLADKAAIQYRVLNESKGHAVMSTRVQIDKDKYADLVEEKIASLPNVQVLRGKVTNISTIDDHFKISTQDLGSFTSKKVVVTAGTFLGAKTHVGPDQKVGGRLACDSAPVLESLLTDVISLKKRFKTGTPPRVNRSSINFEKMIEQPSCAEARNFHFGNETHERHMAQVSCFLTKTSEATLEIIRANKDRSPIFNGQIDGVGPRYCPSIEDKAFRYPDRNVHHVFVEPEGLELDTFYPNGISTSLPIDVQIDFLRTIEGFENVEVAVPGYAVEYDVVDTTKLSSCLEYIEIPGLYFAGQINGTSGYEEAAGQGLVAGANAACSLTGKPPLILKREESYIGVMVEDLVSNLRDEPYRLFTARSENRLFIREDNVIFRMAPYRKAFELQKKIDEYIDNFSIEHQLLNKLCEMKRYLPDEETRRYFSESNYGSIKQSMSLSELLKRHSKSPYSVLAKELVEAGVCFDDKVVYCVAISKVYEGYIQRSDQQLKKSARLDRMKIDWEKIVESSNISNECRQRVMAIKPENFGQLRRMNGIRPASLAVVASGLE